MATNTAGTVKNHLFGTGKLVVIKYNIVVHSKSCEK